MLSTEIAQNLLAIKAVTLSPNDPYTWASGLKSPIYCDNRLTISYPKIRKSITSGFVQLIKETYPNVDVIVGTATAGIPQACWVADAMDLPVAYVRSSSKDHGKQNQIEGSIPAGSNVVVIEDLISTGGSSILACKALEDANVNVLAVVAIFTYEMQRAISNFESAHITYHALTTFSTLVETAIKENYIDEESKETLTLWKHDPVAYDATFHK